MSADGSDLPPSRRRLDIAVVGAGVSGLAAAWLLARRHRVTLYEREGRFGGHCNTVEVVCGRRALAVDTGFIVFNERNYPNFSALLAHLGVASQPTEMSFSVSIDRGRVEYNGGSLAGLAAQPLNLLRPRYLRMLGECLRFFRSAPALLAAPDDGPSLGEFLRRGGYGPGFVEDHLIPMAAAIWSVPPALMLDFPAKTFVRFFANHGLLDLWDRPRWRTLVGGSRRYVERLAADAWLTRRLAARVTALRPTGDGVLVSDSGGATRRFDHAIVATHADEALAMIAAPSIEERRVLGAFRFEPNLAVLHRDASLMPRRRRAWASWNYLAERGGADRLDGGLAVTYWINRLQSLDPAHDLFVTLNPIRAPRHELTIASFAYDHPCFDAAALAAQRALENVQGVRRVWFCGAWTGHGFHEDGLASGLAVAERFGVRRPWAAEPAPIVDTGAAEFLPDRAAAAAD